MTPAPPCTIPYRDAYVTRAAQPVYPKGYKNRSQVLVGVRVTIRGDGTLQSASIEPPSADKALDAAALEAARKSTYAPKIVKCKGVTESYVFTMIFEPTSH